MGYRDASGFSVASVTRLVVTTALFVTMLPAGASAKSPDVDKQALAGRVSAGVLAHKSGLATGLVALGPDEIPGVALGASPQSGTLNIDTNWVDVYYVDLTAGQVWAGTVTGTAVSGQDGYLEGFAPGATTVYDYGDFNPVWDTNKYRLTIHAEVTGRYYIAVWGGTGSYSLAYTIGAGAVDDFIPGVALGASPVSGSLTSSGDTRDVYRIDLTPGQLFSVDLIHSDTVFFDARLFGPGVTHTVGKTPIAEAWDWPISFDFLVPPVGGGTYYLVVETYEGAGGYTVQWSVKTPPAHRLAGSSRFATSLAICRATFVESDVAVLATGAGFPDALAASALAGALDAPLLLVRDDIDSQEYWDLVYELYRLGVTKVYLAGGTSVISAVTEDDLRNGWGFTVTRLGGANRYETGRAIADEVVRVVEARGGTVSSAFVVRGDAFADALAAGPYAFSQKMPVLLTPPGALHPLAAQFIETEDVLDITVVGGTSAVSASVASAADALNAGATGVTRVSGDNRFETAANLAQFAVSQRAWATWEYVGVATGRNFPDALSGSAAAGRRGGVLLLTAPDALSAPASQALSTNASAVRTALVFGGTGAVSGSVMAQIEALID